MCQPPPPTPPTLNVHQRQSQALAGRGGGHAAQCCFGTFWGKERLLVGCSDSSVFPASEAKQAGPLLVSISEPTPLPSAASSWAMAIQLDSAPPWGGCRAGRPSPCAGGPRLCSSRAGSSHLEIQQANILTRMCGQRPGDGLGYLAGLANQPGDWSRVNTKVTHSLQGRQAVIQHVEIFPRGRHRVLIVLISYLCLGNQ